MNWLDKMISMFSVDMRSTIELGELNKLWERFNNKEDVRVELFSRRWKYHQDKADMLLKFHEYLNPHSN